MGRRVKGLARIDQIRDDGRSTHGWYARTRFHGELRSKWFGDRKYGGRARARRCAERWCVETRAELGAPELTCPVVSVSWSGAKRLGVHRRLASDGRDVWEATLTEGGRTRRTNFSVRKHGVREARRLAVAQREAWERDVYGATIV